MNSKKIISALLSAVMTLSVIPSAFAAQSDGSNYINPADSWISTSSRANELDLNAVKTEETFNCQDCNADALFTVFRVPEYTADGSSIQKAGLGSTDGTWAYDNEGNKLVPLDSVNPKGQKYTGHHWTKSVCNKCGGINTNLSKDEYAAYGKNMYVLNVCDPLFFLDFDNSEYSYHDEDTHTTVQYKGSYCQFCHGTADERQDTETEPHNINYTISPEEGNHRFHKEGVCEDCGYNFDGYAIAKSVVADYYGMVDGLAHTVTVADFSDPEVHTRIKYGTEPNNITLNSAPNFTKAGSYSVWYDINYYIGENQEKSSFSEIGEAKVILYNDDSTASLASAQPTPENHAHDYSYRYTIDPTCTKLGYEIWQCDGCGDIEMRNPVAAINHSYKEYRIREATCQQGGYILHICENCGDSYYESTSTASHTYYEDTVPATCTTPGYTKVTCSVCGASYTKDITAIKGHSFRTEVTAPTCTEQGYTTYVCNDCNYSYKSDYTQPTGHKWDGGHIISSGSCNSDGLKEYDCTACGEKRFEAVSASGHKPGAPATCTTPQICTECGAVLAPPTGHSYKASVTAPTCTEKGFTIYTCTKCGDSYTDDYTDPLGHHFHEVVTNPTCTELGYTTYTCTKCDFEYKDNYVAPVAHTYSKEVVNPTCTSMGYTIYTCAVCGDTYKGDYTDKTAHNYSKEVVNPTCEAMGYTIYKCPDCGDYYIGDYTDKAEHHYSAVTTNPTCTEQGYTTYTCSDCNYSYVADYTDPLGHYCKETITEPTCTTMGYTTYECRRCDFTFDGAYTDAKGHDYEETVIPPTCTEWGYSTFKCKVCGDSYTGNPTDKLPHDYEAVVTDPTCTTMGYTTYTCKVCGDSYVGDYTDVSGHNYEETVTEPTCTEMGYTTYVCKDCGHETVGNYTDAKGHNYEETVTEPTCTEMGYTTYVCKDCGHKTIGNYTDAKGHDYEVTVTDPTCTEQGYTTYTCKVCGYSYVGDEKEPTSHSYEEVVTDPTCTELGYTTYTCSVCGHQYKGNYIEALGHKPSKWIIDIPATIENAGSKHIECLTCGTVLQTVEIPQLADIDYSDEDGNASVGAYSIILTDKDGKPVFNSEVSIDVNDNITIKLPDGRLLDYNDCTTITVFITDTQEPVEGLNIAVSDFNNNAATGKTDGNGQLTVPNGQSSTGDGNGTIGDEDDNGKHTYVVTVTDKNNMIIPNCDVSIGESNDVVVKLPEGTVMDTDNRITVTITDAEDNAQEGVDVIVIGDKDYIEKGTTNSFGKVTLPDGNSGYTDNEGIVNVNAYTVIVNDEHGYIENAHVVYTADGDINVELPDGNIISYDNRVTVTVLAPDGTPVEKIKVNVSDNTGEMRSDFTNSKGQVIVPPLNEDITDDDGKGDVEEDIPSTPNPDEPSATPGVEQVHYNVSVRDENGEIKNALIKIENGTVNVELPDGSIISYDNRITVTVTDKDGKPVKDIPVTVTDKTGNSEEDKTNADGQVVVPPENKDYTDTNGEGNVADEIEVPGKDTDGDGIEDVPGETSVKRYTVIVNDENRLIEDAFIILNSDGTISVELPDGSTISHDNRITVTVLDADRNPVQGVEVLVSDSTDKCYRDTTNADGQIVVPPLNEDVTDDDGNGDVEENNPSTPDPSNPSATPGVEITDYNVTVKDGDGKPISGAEITIKDGDVDVELPKGTKPIDYDHRVEVDVTDKDGKPVKDVDVTVTDTDGNEHKGKTDKDGVVVFPPLNEDETDKNGNAQVDGYNVKVKDEKNAIPDAIIKHNSDGSISVELPEENVIDEGNRITVTVTDVDSKPVKGIDVSVSDITGRTEKDVTDENGNAVVPETIEDYTDKNGTAQVDEFIVKVQDEQRPIENAFVKYNPNGSISIRLPDSSTIEYSNRITVTVLNKADEAPVEDMTVSVTDKTSKTVTDKTDEKGQIIVPPLNEDITDDDGKGDIEGDIPTTPNPDDPNATPGVEQVQYNVKVEDTKAVIPNAIVKITDGKVYITLPDTHTLTTSNQTTVTVTNKDGKPVKDVSVTVTDKNNKTATKSTDSNGKVVVPVKSTGSGTGGGSSSSGGSGGSGGGGGSSSVWTNYTVVVKDKDGKTVNCTKSVKDDQITLTLPNGKELDDDNYYTVTVKGSNNKAAEDVNVLLKTRDGKDSAEGKTDKDGVVVLPTAAVKHAAYVIGYDDGEFKPDGNMTRAEAAAIFARNIAERKNETIQSKSSSFTDVDKSAWYNNYISYLEKYDIINGYEDGTFRPDGKITRAEFVAMCTRFYELFDDISGSKTNNFKDISSRHWAVDYINEAVSMNWINGYADGSFKPDNSITRAEVVAIVNRATDRSADRDFADSNKSKVNPFTDMKDTSYWAYYDIIEACNTHTAKVSDDEETWIELGYID